MKTGGVVRPSRVRAARLAVVLAAVAGFFVMHGLATHGAAVRPPTATTALTALTGSTSASADSHTAGHAAAGHAAAGHAAAGHAAAGHSAAGHSAAGHSASHDQHDPAGTHDPSTPHPDMVGLCLAVLVLVAAVALRAGASRPGAVQGSTTRALRSLLATTRVLRPPDLHALSILRC